MSGAGANALGREVVSLCFVPVFWIAGEDLGILIPLVMGGTSILLSRWDAAAVVDLVEACGAVALTATAEEHDAAVALVSHLPQLASSALAARLLPQIASAPGALVRLRR